MHKYFEKLNSFCNHVLKNYVKLEVSNKISLTSDLH